MDGKVGPELRFIYDLCQAITSNRWPFGSWKNTRPWPPRKSLVSMSLISRFLMSVPRAVAASVNEAVEDR